MSLLKTEPVGKVRSLEELLALAHALEREAATRYDELAARAATDGNPALVELFRRLAAGERGHASGVESWSRTRTGNPPDPTLVKWELPDTFEEEAAAELGSSKLASAYRVLSMAVRNKERAFAFWSYVASEARDPSVKAASERLASEELEHVSVLRKARREAYHAERGGRPPERLATPRQILALSAALERRLADRIDELANGLRGDDRARAGDLARQSRQMAEEASLPAPESVSVAAEQDGPVVTLAERLVENYLAVAERSTDEPSAALAQSLAERAISRLAWLRMLV